MDKIKNFFKNIFRKDDELTDEEAQLLIKTIIEKIKVSNELL